MALHHRCAAYTAVDAAEIDAESAWQANAKGHELLATAAARRAIPLMHLSTGYVFDSTQQRTHRSSDPPSPINVYGRSKAAGEDAIRRAAPRHAILRTSWVVSPYGKNIARTNRVQQRQQLRVTVRQPYDNTLSQDGLYPKNTPSPPRQTLQGDL